MVRRIGIACLFLIIASFFFQTGSFAEDGYRKALEQYSKGQYKEAIKTLESYTERNPEPNAYYLLGYALYNLGRNKEANESFKNAFLIDPEFSPNKLLDDLQALKAKEIKKTEKKAAPVKAKEALSEKPVVKTPLKPAEKPVTKTEPAPAPEQKPSVKAEPPAPEKPEAVEKEAAPVVSAPPAAPEAIKPEAAPPRVVQPAVIKPKAAPSPPGILEGLRSTFGLSLLAVPIFIYIYVTLCLFLIAKKLDVPAPWTAFVPVAQLWAFVKAADMPLWFAVLLFIPIINVFIALYSMMRIADNLRRSMWLGILMVIPPVNLIVYGYLAFSKEEKEAPYFEEPPAGELEEAGQVEALTPSFAGEPEEERPFISDVEPEGAFARAGGVFEEAGEEPLKMADEDIDRLEKSLEGIESSWPEDAVQDVESGEPPEIKLEDAGEYRFEDETAGEIQPVREEEFRAAEEEIPGTTEETTEEAAEEGLKATEEELIALPDEESLAGDDEITMGGPLAEDAVFLEAPADEHIEGALPVTEEIPGKPSFFRRLADRFFRKRKKAEPVSIAPPESEEDLILPESPLEPMTDEEPRDVQSIEQAESPDEMETMKLNPPADIMEEGEMPVEKADGFDLPGDFDSGETLSVEQEDMESYDLPDVDLDESFEMPSFGEEQEVKEEIPDEEAPVSDSFEQKESDAGSGTMRFDKADAGEGEPGIFETMELESRRAMETPSGEMETMESGLPDTSGEAREDEKTEDFGAFEDTESAGEADFGEPAGSSTVSEEAIEGAEQTVKGSSLARKLLTALGVLVVFAAAYAIYAYKSVLLPSKEDAKPARVQLKETASWSDVEGDVPKVSDIPGRNMPDILKVTAESKEGFVVIAAEFKDDIEGFFEYTKDKGWKRGAALVEYYLDTDNNPATGGAPWFQKDGKGQRGGYDYKIDAALGFLVKEGISVKEMIGDAEIDPSKFSIIGNVITYSLWKIEDGRLAETGPARWDFGALAGADGKTLRVRIPYQLLGMREGDALRLCYNEAGQKFAEGYSDDMVIRMRGGKAEIKEAETKRWEVFLHAAEKGETDSVKSMVEKKEVSSVFYDIALFKAAEFGHTDIVRYLLGKGVNPNIKDDKGQTPLFFAAVGRKPEIARLLIKKGAKVDTKTASGETPLIRAAAWGDALMVKLLVDAGANVDVKSEHGYSPLNLAEEAKRPDLIQILKKNSKTGG